MEAPGIESAETPANTGKHDETSLGDLAQPRPSTDPNPAFAGDRSIAIVRNDRPPDVVEAALAQALVQAAAAGQWDTVSVLARELEARRRSRSCAVDLASERAKRVPR